MKTEGADQSARSAAVGRRRSPSQLDVARAAGVSGQTVSRVANGMANVDEKTRQRVVAAMREVGYRPNSAARALRSGHFQTLGVIMSDLSTVGNSRTLDAICTSAAEADYSISLMPLLEPTQQGVAGAFRRLGEQAVDGVIILIEAHRLDQGELELPDGLPVVVVDSSAHYDFPIIDTDQAQGARLATEHLLELGHKTVWHVSGPARSFAAGRREQSWRETLRRHGRTEPPTFVGDWTAESGYRLGADIAAEDGISAVFAANDQMALGLMRALHEVGRRIPHDISVVGFDDIDEAANFWPPLTTVRQNFAAVGRRSVRALLEEIHTGKPGHSLITVPTTLQVRASTAAPRRPARVLRARTRGEVAS